jgi:3-O-methylgallate 3,4-dioxygenase
MAQVVLGMAASRSPMVSAPPELWPLLGERDQRRRIKDRDGNPLTYETLLEAADPSLMDELTPQRWQEKYDAAQSALETLSQTVADVRPDIVVAMGDDEEENIHDDNRPAMLVYWGDTYENIPRAVGPDADPITRATASAWGDRQAKYPIAADLGKRLIGALIEAEFDIGSSRYQKPGEGMAHGFGFMYQRLLRDCVVPVVPIILNVHTLPNQPTPKRLYEFGRAVRAALATWDEKLRVAVIATGGLSVGIVDEELDRLALSGMKSRSVSTLSALPRTWMQGSQGEVLCWIATAGAVEHLEMEILDYIPGYRSPAGTGCGLAFARWL